MRDLEPGRRPCWTQKDRVSRHSHRSQPPPRVGPDWADGDIPSCSQAAWTKFPAQNESNGGSARRPGCGLSAAERLAQLLLVHRRAALDILLLGLFVKLVLGGSLRSAVGPLAAPL